MPVRSGLGDKYGHNCQLEGYNMIPAQGVTGKNVGVLGLGRSGLTAALALRAGGAEVRVWDDQEPARQAAAEEGKPPRQPQPPSPSRPLR